MILLEIAIFTFGLICMMSIVVYMWPLVSGILSFMWDKIRGVSNND